MALAVAVGLFLASPAAAQFATRTGVVAGPVSEIRVEGTQRIAPETVRAYVTVQPGSQVDAEEIDRSLKALFGTGLFADVQLGVQNGDLIVQIVENPIINQVVFEGNSAVSQDKLTKEVTLQPRGIYTRAKVQEDVGSIVELYRLQGRISATVTPKLVQLEQNRVDVIFEINEGPQTGISAINGREERQQMHTTEQPLQRPVQQRVEFGDATAAQTIDIGDELNVVTHEG
jgi:outer membrane protein insertion porin family